MPVRYVSGYWRSLVVHDLERGWWSTRLIMAWSTSHYTLPCSKVSLQRIGMLQPRALAPDTLLFWWPNRVCVRTIFIQLFCFVPQFDDCSITVCQSEPSWVQCDRQRHVPHSPLS